MAAETPGDTTPVPKASDAQAGQTPKAEPRHSLGGDLLVSASAGKTPVADANGLHSVTIAGLGPEKATLSANATKTLVSSPAVNASEAPAKVAAGTQGRTGGDSTAPAAPQPTELELKQQAYDRAHGQYDKDAKAYWDGVAAAKKNHTFVLDFPPIYTGPDKPKVPGQPPAVVPNSVPTIRQMLDDSKHLNQFAAGDKTQPEFNLRQVGEAEFKQRYTQEALNIGQQYGLDKDKVRGIVRGIYAFEDGGWGTHETLSSMPQSLVTDDKPAGTTSQTARLDFHVEGVGASSALGYNQLLTATTMEDIQFQSKPIADRLNQLAQQDPARAAELEQKAKMVSALGGALDREVMAMAKAEKSKKPEDQKQYLDGDGHPTDLLYRDFLKSSEPTAAGMTRQDMARAVQALNLDGDIGPIIQAKELGNLLKNASQYGYDSLLQGKEQSDKQALSAYDALPAVQKQQAVHDILDRLKPPAGKGTTAGVTAGSTPLQDFNTAKNSLEQKLLAMGPGIDNNLSQDKLTKGEADLMRTGVLTSKEFGDPSGPLSHQSDLLLNKIVQSYYGGTTATNMMPAALELANLAGPKNAQGMMDAHNQDVPTPNFFSRAGYTANPVTNGRTGSELLLQIKRIMSGPSYSAQEKPGQADFDRAFDAAKGP